LSRLSPDPPPDPHRQRRQVRQPLFRSSSIAPTLSDQLEPLIRELDGPEPTTERGVEVRKELAVGDTVIVPEPADADEALQAPGADLVSEGYFTPP